MKWAPLVAAMAAGAFLTACAGIHSPQAKKTPVSPDYEAAGAFAGMRAFVYGKHTVIEFSSQPLWVTIQDENGVAVPYEREGRYYRLSRKVDNFTVWANARSIAFSAIPHAAPAATAMSPAATPAPTHSDSASPVVVSAEAAPDDDSAELLRLSAAQLDDVRRAINAGTASAAQAKALNHRLDQIEAQLVKAAAALVQVQFQTASTEFAPDARLVHALIPAAKAAERINVRGRTDSRIPGLDDPRIAMGRALAARQFLMEHGVDGDKIKVFAQPAGDFIAPADTAEGKALNRRVEIELVNRRFAELRTEAGRLQAKR